MASAVLLVGLVALFIMAAISAWLTWAQAQQAINSRLSADLRFSTMALLSAVQEAHLAHNIYVTRGDRESLDTLDHAWREVDRLNAEMRLLIREDSRHNITFRTVDTLIAERERAYQNMKNGGPRMPAEDASLTEIGRQLKQISAVETADVMQTRRDAAQSRTWLMAGTTGTALIASLLCFGAYVMIRRRLHVLEASERVLSAFNAELETNVRQRTAELEQTKADVEREKGRAEALLADLNHRVGNSLQMVSSLVNMHATRVTSSEARGILESVRAHIHAIASAQRRIRLVETSDRVELAALLGSLIDDMKVLGSSGGQVAMTLEAEEAVVSSNDAISISVIVMEAINNAIKYASAGDAPIAIKVRVASDQEKRPVTVSVEDDGIGFDDTAAPGLGSEVTGALAASLKARITHSHVDAGAERRGTRITLDFRAAQD
jgi:two-component sensor histidine kinase